MKDHRNKYAKSISQRAASSLRGKLFITMAFALLAPISHAASAMPWSADGPVFSIDSARRDFGDVFAGEDLTQVFTVRNAGTKPLELSQKSSLSMRSVRPEPELKAASWERGTRSFLAASAWRPAAPS